MANNTAGATVPAKTVRASRLHIVTLDLLRQRVADSKGRDDTLVGIAQRTKLNFHWLEHFLRGSETSPAVDKVETLYEHLSGQKLHLAR